MAEKSDTQRKLLEQARRLSNNLRSADTISEKNTTNSRLVQSGNRDDILRGRSGSQGSKNLVIAVTPGLSKTQTKPASSTGSRLKQIEVNEDFIHNRVKTTAAQRSTYVQSELQMTKKEKSPLLASSEFKQASLASGYRTHEKPSHAAHAVGYGSDIYENETTSQRVSKYLSFG